MKTLLYAISALCLSFSVVSAADDEYVEQAVDLEELASRMNVIKPADYIKMTEPIKESAHQAAKNLTDKDAQMLIDGQNRVNRRLARRNGETEPKPLSINANDRDEIEKLLTPQMYTYDDEPK